jgi:hypothetical protein
MLIQNNESELIGEGSVQLNPSKGEGLSSIGGTGGTGPDYQDNSDDIIPFTEVLQEDLRPQTVLRIPFIENADMLEETKRCSSSTIKQLKKHQKTIDCASSSYYKVSLTAEKAKIRQSSLGQRSNLGRGTSESTFFTPLS